MSVDHLQTLFLPFETKALPWPAGKTLFINARLCPGWQRWAPPGHLVTAQQFFKPHAVRLEAAGYAVQPDIPTDGAYDAVLIAGGKQKKETLAFLAAALPLLKPAGTLVCAAPNDMGGKRLGKAFQTLGLEGREEKKHHARVIWASVSSWDRTAADDWAATGRLQPVCGGAFMSRPGIFGWDKIDRGSALLAERLPTDLTGLGADFGCGYGFLSRAAQTRNPGVSKIWAIDADWRALAACRENIENSGSVACLWEDLTKPVAALPPLDWVVMNPPFHADKQAQVACGQAFIENAARSLKPGGRLFMVANVHLPYEPVLRAGFTTVDKRFEGDGFKIFVATR
ncbi:MAG: class I SAM-dependent methyltransferase [Alphaproteobacteria bacterium]|nr:class I SAM-dependent methyltransferase [Alphaproteobacteria bacterium]